MAANKNLIKYWFLTIFSSILLLLIPSEVKADNLAEDTLFGEIITIGRTRHGPYGRFLHLWAAFEHGLMRYELDDSEDQYLTGTVVPIADLSDPDVINSYTRDTTVYVVCSTGIYWYEPYSDVNWDSSAEWNCMLETGIKDCAVDSLNRIWFITEDSVFSYSPKGIRMQYQQGELQHCQAIGVDVDNTVWITYRKPGYDFSSICCIPFGSEEIEFFPFTLLDSSGVLSASNIRNSWRWERVCTVSRERKIIWYNDSSMTWDSDNSTVPDSVIINDICVYWDRCTSYRIAAVATDKGIYWGPCMKFRKFTYGSCVSIIPAPVTDITAFAASEEGVTFQTLSPCLSVAPDKKAAPQILQSAIPELRVNEMVVNLLGRAVITGTMQHGKTLSSGVYLYYNPALRQSKTRFLYLSEGRRRGILCNRSLF